MVPADMKKSWAYGAATVLIAHVLWLVLILIQANADWVMPAIVMMLFVIINIAGIAAFVSALRAPRDPVLLGLTMAPLAAVITTAGNLLLVASGSHLDFTGAGGSLDLFFVALTYGFFVAAIGAGIGAWLAQRRAAP
jgi:hypothetical protein